MNARSLIRKYAYNVTGTYVQLSVGSKYKRTQAVKGDDLRVEFDCGLILYDWFIR